MGSTAPFGNLTLGRMYLPLTMTLSTTSSGTDVYAVLQIFMFSRWIPNILVL